jgi:hypothetical protein
MKTSRIHAIAIETVASHKGKDSLENPRFAWLLTPGFNFLVKDFVFLRLLGRLAVP